MDSTIVAYLWIFFIYRPQAKRNKKLILTVLYDKNGTI